VTNGLGVLRWAQGSLGLSGYHTEEVINDLCDAMVIFDASLNVGVVQDRGEKGIPDGRRGGAFVVAGGRDGSAAMEGPQCVAFRCSFGCCDARKTTSASSWSSVGPPIHGIRVLGRAEKKPHDVHSNRTGLAILRTQLCCVFQAQNDHAAAPPPSPLLFQWEY